MQKHLVSILFAALIGLSAGCSRAPEEAPSPSPTTAAEIVLVKEDAALSTPMAELPTVTPTPAQEVAPSPLEPPTPPVAAMPQAATMPPFPSPYKADGTPITGTPVPATPLVICEPQEESFACYDELLDMTFSYPDFMGPIDHTMLRQGGQGGFGYEYMFVDWENYAGGRSRDFAEGRGPRYTDQEGFNGRSAADICAEWVAAGCVELGPGAVLIIMLPQADWLCSDAMMFTPVPHIILALDLPQHPLINGFGFSFSLLSKEGATAFQEEWYSGDKQCAPETKTALGTAMAQLSSDLQAGSATPEIQTRYDAMIRIAESIQSPYFTPAP